MREKCENLHLEHLNAIGNDKEIHKFLKKVKENPKKTPVGRTEKFYQIYTDS